MGNSNDTQMQRNMSECHQDNLFFIWKRTKELFLNKNNSDISDYEFKQMVDKFEQLGQNISKNSNDNDTNTLQECFYVMNSVLFTYLKKYDGNFKAKKLSTKMLNDAFEIYDDNGLHIKK
ncbi:hypothetical protein MOO46_01990 [Apilactobacillus apisilvae]|uniref:Plasmodium variant antigen protein Cir/Yir/Bir n=1 Tax=Apilactobacillus apisilvae TaxID=2923364 RepID=A0ABY4PIH2_9LACO|nr:hypothetical protein [Apilactobacillus apisilvae]UQS85382.1 hypothetical protein MOO46_01990 [Apilactobacillus apisilvae]